MKNNLILCSAIKGVLLNHGQPLVGVKIQREIKWNVEQESRVDYVETDDNGTYCFPEQLGTLNLGFFANLFYRPVIEQSLRLVQDGPSMLIFSGVRDHHFPVAELGVDYVEIRTDLKNAIEVDPALYTVKSMVKENQAA